jgi:hypothetical protein
LTPALSGYQHQLEGIHARMAEIRSALGKKTPATTRPKRKMSAAGRARIAAAQRASWAASKKQAAPAKPKRRLSAAGRAAIVAATEKRWEAVRAAKVQPKAAAAAKRSARKAKPAPRQKAAAKKVAAEPAPAPVPQAAGE